MPGVERDAREKMKEGIMPKESINTPPRRVFYNGPDGELGFFTEPGGDSGQAGPYPDATHHVEAMPVLTVRWGKSEPHLGQEEDGSVYFELHIAEEELLRMADQIRRDRDPEYVPPVDEPKYAGVWWSNMVEFSTAVFSRAELQKLIKVTRRARDAAYGEDA